MAKLMAPNIRIDWYPEGHFADPSNPTLAELNSGYNLSCAIVTGFTLDFTDSNTVDISTIYDNYESLALTHYNYEAELQFFLAQRENTVDSNEESYRMAEELFYHNQNVSGYFVKRFGYKWDRQHGNNQSIDIFHVKSTAPRIVSDRDSPILLEVTFIPLGFARAGIGYFYEIPKTNLLLGGDFENGVANWSVSGIDSIVSTQTDNDKMWGGLGGYMMLAEGNSMTAPYGRSHIVSQYVDIELPREIYVAISGYLAVSEGVSSNWIRMTFTRIDGTTFNVDTNSLPEIFFEGKFAQRVYKLPTEIRRLQVRLYANSRAYQSNIRFWADKIMLALGSSEEEALDNSKVFKPHKDELNG